MEMIQQHTIGTMLLTLQSDQPSVLQQALKFFADRNVIIEVLGYVRNVA
jgi:prephenate dehydratase